MHRFYGMRIENKGASVLGGISQFSVPARCFEASLQTAHRLDMHVSFGDAMMGFQWRFHRSLDCTIENRVDMPSWPSKSDVSLLMPQMSADSKVALMDGTPCPLALHTACCASSVNSLLPGIFCPHCQNVDMCSCFGVLSGLPRD